MASLVWGNSVITDEAFRPGLFTWRAGTSTATNPHMFPMAIFTPIGISNFGKTWTLTDTSALFAGLSPVADGKRVMRWQSQGWLMTNADDRCNEGYPTVQAAVDAGVLSASPVNNGKWYANATGGDGKPSGWSNLLFTANLQNAVAWAASLADAIHNAGLTVQHCAMDSELFIDQFNVVSAWRAALRADSRWTTQQLPALDAIVTEMTGGAQTTFNDTGNWFLDPVMSNAWYAYQQQQQALMQVALVQGMRTQFPNCTVTDDSFFGRIQPVVTAGQPWMVDINGHPYAVTNSSIVDYTNEEQYGQMDQVEATRLHDLTQCYLAGSLNPFITVIWELARSMGSIQSGNRLKSWVNYPGSGRTDMQLGGEGIYSASDPCPYWQSQLALTALLGAIPERVSNGYSPCGLTAYYSDSITDMDITLSNGGVDQANHLFWDNGDRTAGPFKAGYSTGFTISQSTGNDGNYTINYENGGIWYDNTSAVTYFRVNESIPSAISDGKILNKATDGTDALAEAIIADLDQHIGNVGPRSVIQRTIYLGASALVTDTQALANGNFITWGGLQHGLQQTDCIVIGRSGVVKSAWTAQAITGYINGVSQGVVATVPANRAYVYFTHAYSAAQVWTYSWSQSAVTNLLGSQDFTNSGVWTKNGSSIATSSTHPDPIHGGNAYLFTATQATATFSVKPGKVYCAAVYAWGEGPQQTQILKGSDDTVIVTLNDQEELNARWQLYFVNFVAPHGETTCKFVVNAPPANNYQNYYVWPQVVQGMLPGPIL